MNERLYVVTADAICGQGKIYPAGKVVSEDQLWGIAPKLIAQGAIQPVEGAANPKTESRERGVYLG